MPNQTRVWYNLSSCQLWSNRSCQYGHQTLNYDDNDDDESVRPFAKITASCNEKKIGNTYGQFLETSSELVLEEWQKLFCNWKFVFNTECFNKSTERREIIIFSSTDVSISSLVLEQLFPSVNCLRTLHYVSHTDCFYSELQHKNCRRL